MKPEGAAINQVNVTGGIILIMPEYKFNFLSILQ